MATYIFAQTSDGIPYDDTLSVCKDTFTARYGSEIGSEDKLNNMFHYLHLFEEEAATITVHRDGELVGIYVSLIIDNHLQIVELLHKTVNNSRGYIYDQEYQVQFANWLRDSEFDGLVASYGIYNDKRIARRDLWLQRHRDLGYIVTQIESGDLRHEVYKLSLI